MSINDYRGCNSESKVSTQVCERSGKGFASVMKCHEDLCVSHNIGTWYFCKMKKLCHLAVKQLFFYYAKCKNVRL